MNTFRKFFICRTPLLKETLFQVTCLPIIQVCHFYWACFVRTEAVPKSSAEILSVKKNPLGGAQKFNQAKLSHIKMPRF